MKLTKGLRKYSDVEIVEAYQKGIVRIQEYWYARCRVQVWKGTSQYSGITDYDRHDIFQDSFIILWQKIESGQIYIESGGVYALGLTGKSAVPDLMGYFMKIVKNKYLEFISSSDRIPQREPLSEEETREIVDFLYWDQDSDVTYQRIVGQALLSMPASCVEILKKFYYENKNLREILAERPENTSYEGLKTRKSKCVAALKKKSHEIARLLGLHLLKENHKKAKKQ